MRFVLGSTYVAARKLNSRFQTSAYVCPQRRKISSYYAYCVSNISDSEIRFDVFNGCSKVSV